MTPSICYVTCVYEPNELNPELIKQPSINPTLMRRYFNALLSIRNSLNSFFVIYCSSKNYENIHKFLKENFAEQTYTLIKQNPEDFKAFKIFNDNKKFFTEHEVQRRREYYIPMVLSKPDMLMRALSLYDADNYIWIDAGLAHETYFPIRYRDGDLIPVMGDYFHEYLNKIFNNHDLFFICNKFSAFFPWVYEEQLNDINGNYSVTGGLWGGSKNAVKIIFNKYSEYLIKSFNIAMSNPGKFPFTEEALLSAVLRFLINENLLKVKVSYFSAFIHEDDWSSIGFSADDEELVFLYQVLIGVNEFDRNGLLFTANMGMIDSS